MESGLDAIADAAGFCRIAAVEGHVPYAEPVDLAALVAAVGLAPAADTGLDHNVIGDGVGQGDISEVEIVEGNPGAIVYTAGLGV